LQPATNKTANPNLSKKIKTKDNIEKRNEIKPDIDPIV
jgi:hypothetical protein